MSLTIWVTMNEFILLLFKSRSRRNTRSIWKRKNSLRILRNYRSKKIFQKEMLKSHFLLFCLLKKRTRNYLKSMRNFLKLYITMRENSNSGNTWKRKMNFRSNSISRKLKDREWQLLVWGIIMELKCHLLSSKLSFSKMAKTLI